MPLPSSSSPTSIILPQGVLKCSPDKDPSVLSSHWRWPNLPGAVGGAALDLGRPIQPCALEDEVGELNEKQVYKELKVYPLFLLPLFLYSLPLSRFLLSSLPLSLSPLSFFCPPSSFPPSILSPSLHQHVKFRKSAECDKPRVVWNVERRCWLPPDTNTSLLQLLSQCPLWPVEVGRWSVPGGGGKGKGKEEEPLLSFHGVAYVNLSPLLYPGGEGRREGGSGRTKEGGEEALWCLY